MYRGVRCIIDDFIYVNNIFSVQLKENNHAVIKRKRGLFLSELDVMSLKLENRTLILCILKCHA